MNARTLVLIGAIALVGIGLLLTLSDFLSPAPPAARLYPAVAKGQIQPYTVITQDMVAQGEAITQSDAKKFGVWQVKDVLGTMSTALISPGTTMTTMNALPIEQVRFTDDLNMEVVSFQAGVDRMVSGKLRPGVLVNVYGYGRENETNIPFTNLIEPRVWVVGVSAGGQDVTNATLVPDPKTGIVSQTGGDTDRPVTTLTVAVTPQQAFNLINSLGAQGLSAWVTLAANQSVASTGLATPIPVATATPGLPLDISLTATALWKAIQATPAPKGPRTGGGGVR